jgi:hypothetical protein
MHQCTLTIVRNWLGSKERIHNKLSESEHEKRQALFAIGMACCEEQDRKKGGKIERNGDPLEAR